MTNLTLNGHGQDDYVTHLKLLGPNYMVGIGETRNLKFSVQSETVHT